jgi:hypothetical protein
MPGLFGIETYRSGILLASPYCSAHLRQKRHGHQQKRITYGSLGSGCFHVCVDMQKLFAEDTEWKTPWMGRVLPKIRKLVAARPTRTIFTRFKRKPDIYDLIDIPTAIRIEIDSSAKHVTVGNLRPRAESKSARSPVYPFRSFDFLPA